MPRQTVTSAQQLLLKLKCLFIYELVQVINKSKGLFGLLESDWIGIIFYADPFDCPSGMESKILDLSGAWNLARPKFTGEKKENRFLQVPRFLLSSLPSVASTFDPPHLLHLRCLASPSSPPARATTAAYTLSSTSSSSSSSFVDPLSYDMTTNASSPLLM